MTVDLSMAAHTVQGMLRAGIALLPNLLIAVLVFTLVWFGARALGRSVTHMLDRARKPRSVSLVLGRLARWLVMGMGSLVALTIVVPSLNASALLGALGVGGVAIGFAFKDIFQNLLAGLLLLMTRPFQIGDQIISGNHEGTVEDIQMRATLMRAYDGRLVVIPNSDLYTNRVTVITRSAKRRGVVNVGVAYDASIEQAKRVVLRALDGMPQLEKAPAPSVVATSLDDSSVNLAVRFWVAPPPRGDLVGATDAVIIATKRALDAAGIEIPFPTRTMVVPAGAAAPTAQEGAARAGVLSATA